MKVSGNFLLLSLICLSLSQKLAINGATCHFGHFVSQLGDFVEFLTSFPRCRNLLEPCHNCSEGFKLNSDKKQCQQCYVGQIYCTGNKIVCAPNYKYENKICKPRCVVKNCKECQSIFTQYCSICSENFQLSNDNKKCISHNMKIQGNQTQRSHHSRNLQQQIVNQLKSTITLDQFIGNQNQPYRQCLVNEYKDKDNKCEMCNDRCATCINTQDQCLQCNEGYTKIGWKCVSSSTILFQFLLTLLNITTNETRITNLTNTINSNNYTIINRSIISNLSDNIHGLKKQLLLDILPSAYNKQPLSVLSLASLSVNKQTNQITINGAVDKIGNFSHVDFNQSIASKIGQQRQIGPFLLLSYRINVHNSNYTNLRNRLQAQSSISNTKCNLKKQQCQDKLVQNTIIIITMLCIIFIHFLVICYGYECLLFANKQSDSTQNAQQYIGTNRRIEVHRQQQNNIVINQFNEPPKIEGSDQNCLKKARQNIVGYISSTPSITFKENQENQANQNQRQKESPHLQQINYSRSLDHKERSIRYNNRQGQRSLEIQQLVNSNKLTPITQIKRQQ